MIHALIIPRWHPTPLNRLLGDWRRAARLKAMDRQMVAGYLWDLGIPKATGKRRVTLRITLGPRQRAADPDAYWKTVLDALKTAGALVDDSRQWCELLPVEFDRGPEMRTTITLEDAD